MTTKRGIISLNGEQAIAISSALTTILEDYGNQLGTGIIEEITEWRNRFFSIAHITADTIPIHFTDLGTEL